MRQMSIVLDADSIDKKIGLGVMFHDNDQPLHDCGDEEDNLDKGLESVKGIADEQSS